MRNVAQEATGKAQAQMQHPLIELLGRYKAIFKIAWEQRVELAGPKRLADEQAFLPAALSLQDTPVHPAPRRVAYLLIALFMIALAWAILGKIDIVAVGTGRIIVSDRTKVVQPLENSVVRRIHVREGDHVEAGQLLLELDPTTANADKISLQEAYRATLSEGMRTRALLNALSIDSATAGTDIRLAKDEIPMGWTDSVIANAQAHLTAEWSDIKARLAKLNAEHYRRQAEIVTVQSMISKLEATVPMVRKREQDYQALADQGFMSGHANQDRTRERIELERDLATQRARLQEALAASQEAEQTRRAYIAETRRALSERIIQIELKLEQTIQELSKATHREKLTTLVAPVAGTVQQLAIHTEGGVVTEAQPLMVIVPDSGSVSAEVTLENKDIGFVFSGQDVTIKLETFPFTRYGTIPATVEKVTQDAVNDEKRGQSFPHSSA